MHISSESLAAYLSGNITAVERAAIEAHLATCDACRGEIVAAQAVIARRRRPRRALGSLALLGAAAVLLLVVRPPASEPRTAAGVSELRAGAPGEPLVAIAPAPGAAVPRDSVVFTWHGAGPDRLYRLQVVTQAGELTWGFETRDTVAVLPMQALPPPGAYLWYVDAIGTDGDSATTGLVAFTLD